MEVDMSSDGLNKPSSELESNISTVTTEHGDANANPDDLQNDEQSHDDVFRVTRLRKALKKTVRKSMATIRQRDLKKYFNPVYDHNPQAMPNIRNQLLKQLETNISEEISNMFDEENIESLLNDLDKIEKHQTADQMQWRPSGKPTVDLRPYLQPVRVKHCNHLRDILSELESRNRMLQDLVQARQGKLHTTLGHLNEECAVWSKVDHVPQEYVDALENFVSTE